jgi:hypothetical protein
MHSCYNSYIVFGWEEDDRNQVIDEFWLDEHFKDIEIYVSDVVKNYAGNAIYGISCNLNTSTGQAVIEDKYRSKVEEAYKIIENTSNRKLTPLGFHLALSGDYCWSEHVTYIPREE